MPSPSACPSIVTRFAPSPTGFLHIGGARTALYNWLLARGSGGKFLLRIEDTDQERSSDAAVSAILEGLTWLGLDWDGAVVSQADRAARHAEIARLLIEKGHAYHCYASPKENATARDQARAAGTQFLGDLWRNRDSGEAPAGRHPVVRFKMPRSGETSINDAVQGSVTVSNTVLDDLVILRADGSPTYMLSVVVDDHDMGITHVVRGDDHLNNSFKQVQIYQAMGWPLPVFGHIPLIHGADGKKLSKRHGALGIDAYRDKGYLAKAVNTYLLRLGWSKGDTEIITKEQAALLFNLEDVNKGAARFDFDKLDHINGNYLRQEKATVLFDMIRSDIEKIIDRDITSVEQARILQALPSVAERAKRLGDLVIPLGLCCDRGPLDIDQKIVEKLPDTAADLVENVAKDLDTLKDYDADNIKNIFVNIAQSKGIKVGQIMQPVRAAITGGHPYGDLIQLMIVLGKSETISRLKGARF